VNNFALEVSICRKRQVGHSRVGQPSLIVNYTTIESNISMGIVQLWVKPQLGSWQRTNPTSLKVTAISAA
jgi:hypothetical protein